MTVTASEDRPKRSSRSRRRDEASEPKVALKPRERVVYGLKAKIGANGFRYGAVDDFVFEDDLVAYVRAGLPGREYLVVFGRRRGLADIRHDRTVVQTLDADEKRRVRALYERSPDLFRQKADLITFW